MTSTDLRGQPNNASAAAPFIVFSLPRSRSAWTSALLSCEERPVGHDIAMRCATLEDFQVALSGAMAGTCETGAMFAFQLLRDLLPDAKMATIRRDPGEVVASLERLGLTGLDDEIAERDGYLDRIEGLPGVMRIDYAELSEYEPCARLYDFCHGEKLSPERWQSLAGMNIQVDLPRRLKALRENHAQIEALKAEARSRQEQLRLVTEQEHFTEAWWLEVQAMAAQHSAEVEGDIEPRWRFEVDVDAMVASDRAGSLKVFSARKNGSLVGYYMWRPSYAIESRGLLIAEQGPFYVAPGHPGVAAALYEHSITALRRMGVKCVFPHVRTLGRGARFGRFLERRGARKIQETYMLWIGD